ncbi:MAG: hypothetical protein EA409_08900 [Saprospirales bacterium]|nr:MAG: hypothetical protein EA409_08900 [Saprospirales bacterium]
MFSGKLNVPFAVLLVVVTVSLLIVQCQSLRTVPLDLSHYEVEFASLSNHNPCSHWEYYVPDSLERRNEVYPMRQIRVNFHFLYPSDSSVNIPIQKTSHFVRHLMYNLDAGLSDNRRMKLPRGNNTPNLPVNYRYLLYPDWDHPEGPGIYHHFDDDHYWMLNKGRSRNNFDRTVVNKYAVGLDSVVNVFLLPPHPDSLASPTYNATINGIAMGHAVKISADFQTDMSLWSLRGIFDHELGHVLGLRHSWRGMDGCPDTPAHPNCWNYTRTGPCDSLVSNNVMDYNAWQQSWTPCQLGRINAQFHNLRSRVRNLLVRDWCEEATRPPLEVRDSITWYGAVDLNTSLIIKRGGHLSINCRLSLPPDGFILVENGGSLSLNDAFIHQDCGMPWRGVFYETKNKRTEHAISISGESFVVF